MVAVVVVVAVTTAPILTRTSMADSTAKG